MKHLLTTAIYLPLILLLMLAGCVQVIHERPDGTRLKVNTLFKSVFSDGFYYDPNDGFIEVDKYKGETDKIEFQYNPYTGVKLKTGTKLERK